MSTAFTFPSAGTPCAATHFAPSAEVESDDGYSDGSEAEDEKLSVPLFTVTNPPETVTVTAFMDGRVHQIELAPKVTNLTERDLAEEILVIAGLAASRPSPPSTRSCSRECGSMGTTTRRPATF